MTGPDATDESAIPMMSETLVAKTQADEGLSLPSGPDGQPAEAALPKQIGRFAVLRKLGQGGMGVVYSGFDEDLDRRVAIKVLSVRKAVGTQGHDRMRREAQAMAKLSHPNVAQIYEVGTHAGQLYMAIEFVKGQTVAEWVAERAREMPEILGVFRQAARGLVAAHEAGLVHRDFKPDNVMVGEDGRVRVLDFGLARAAGEVGPKLEPVDEAAGASVSGSHASLDVQLTATGAMIGTPAYMSPEQFEGMPTDAKTDQFSFCLSLYEALYGERPHKARDLASLALAVLEGKIRDAPANSKVPPWIRSVVLRGLQPVPRDRYESMEELLLALDADPARKRRRVLAIGAGVLAMGGSLALALSSGSEDSVCTGGEEEVAATWDETRKGEVSSALLGTGLSYAADTTVRAVARLDEFAGAWAGAHREACEATAVQRTQSAELMDLRMSCLRQRLGRAEAVVAVLANADATVAENALDVVDGLPTLEACADAEFLRAQVKPPEDPEVARQVEEIDRGLAEVGAMVAAGKYVEATPLVATQVEHAEPLGYEPVLARALVEAGRLHERAGRNAESEDCLTRAYYLAAGVGDDGLAAQAATQLVLTIGVRAARHEDAPVWARLAEVALSRTDARGGRAEALLLVHRSGVLDVQGKYAEAGELAQQALSSLEKLEGTALARAGALDALGRAEHRLGHHEKAIEIYGRSLAIIEEEVGPEHPQVGSTYSNLGVIEFENARWDEAEKYLKRSIEIREAALGIENAEVAKTLGNLAGVYSGRGDQERAAEIYRRVLAMDIKVLGPTHPDVARDMNNLGSVLYRARKLDEAEGMFLGALDLFEKNFGREHPNVGTAMHNVGAFYFEQGKFEQAEKLHREALGIIENGLGPDHWLVAIAATGLAHDRLALGDPEEALGLAERAVKLREATDTDPAWLAESRLVVAEALTRLGQDPERALELATKARDELIKSDAEPTLLEDAKALVAKLQ